MDIYKSVLVKSANGRNFKVKFRSEKEKSDFGSFKEAFLKICENDCDLHAIANKEEHHRLSFQQYDDLFKCNVELTDYEEIVNGAVLELYISTSAVLPIDITVAEQMENKCESTSITNSDASAAVQSSGSSIHQDESIESDALNIKTTISSRSNRQIRQYKPTSLAYPCPMPKLSAAMMHIIENGKIQQNYGKFIRECAAHLLSLVEKPTRADYDAYCKTLAHKYEFLNVNNIPGSTPYSFFKKTLSHSIRNSRHYALKKASKSSTVEILIDTDKVTNTDEEVKMHNLELVRCFKKKSIDTAHVGELMKATAAHRRKTITSCNLKIAELQQMFPALQFQEWILFDFALETNTSSEERKESFSKGIDTLRKMANEEGFGNNSILDILKWAEKKLSPTKNLESCILKFKVGDAVMNSCNETQAPHLVIYLQEDGQIAASMILAQGGIACKLTNTEIFSIFDTLLGVYFTFYFEYPRAYHNFLMLLQFLLLKNCIKGQKVTSSYAKFMRKYEECR